MGRCVYRHGRHPRGCIHYPAVLPLALHLHHPRPRLSHQLPPPRKVIAKEKISKFFISPILFLVGSERPFCERHNCRIYPDNRGIYWHFKVADYPAYTLPSEISRAYLNHEISIRDVYVYWRKNESCM